MSLTSFLKIPEVKEKFSIEFAQPDFKANSPLLAPPQTEHYALVGTAFDYLLRFQLLISNSKAVEKPWVAHNSLALLLVEKAESKIITKAEKIISEAILNQQAFLKDGKLSEDLLSSCIKLAQLDATYRGSSTRGEPYIAPDLGIIDSLDIKDLKNLISLIDLEKFKAKKVCLLNPTFGEASMLVGGADCDLVLDDMLVDIKTTKNLKLTRDYFNQLIGYYVLSKISSIDRSPKGHEIKRLAVYFSRHGYMHIYTVNEIVNQKKLNDFIPWFKEKAQFYFKSTS